MSCAPVGWAACCPGLLSVLKVLPAMTKTTYAAPVNAPHLSTILIIPPYMPRRLSPPDMNAAPPGVPPSWEQCPAVSRISRRLGAAWIHVRLPARGLLSDDDEHDGP